MKTTTKTIIGKAAFLGVLFGVFFSACKVEDVVSPAEKNDAGARVTKGTNGVTTNAIGVNGPKAVC